IKAVQDLKTHGKVLRGYLGVELVDLDKVNPNHIEQFGLTTEEFRHSKGVLVHNVVENGSADNAGIKKGDFIIGINGKNVYSSPQLMEGIAQLSPGETVEVQISRKGKVSSSKLTLQGEEELIAAAKQARSKSSAAAKSTANARDSNTPINLQSLGIKYKELSKDEAQRLNISGGIQITDITEGVIKSNTNIRPGFIIFNLNEEEVTKEEDVRKAIRKSNRSVEIAGKYPNQNGIHYYNIQK
ncbi:MAG TPA: PDZ domain-containing protein, partial [Chitinophagaceae bacterium]|nr:PDZ domain-containing protein [Chitinophagaceae bacterium]